MSAIEVRNPISGVTGQLHAVEFRDPNSVLIFQLSRKTDMINEQYIRNAQLALKDLLPQGRKALIVGSDVNVYELAGADAAILRLKGLF